MSYKVAVVANAIAKREKLYAEIEKIYLQTDKEAQLINSAIKEDTKKLLDLKRERTLAKADAISQAIDDDKKKLADLKKKAER